MRGVVLLRSSVAINDIGGQKGDGMPISTVGLAITQGTIAKDFGRVTLEGTGRRLQQRWICRLTLVCDDCGVPVDSQDIPLRRK